MRNNKIANVLIDIDQKFIDFFESIAMSEFGFKHDKLNKACGDISWWFLVKGFKGLLKEVAE